MMHLRRALCALVLTSSSAEAQEAEPLVLELTGASLDSDAAHDALLARVDAFSRTAATSSASGVPLVEVPFVMRVQQLTPYRVLAQAALLGTQVGKPDYWSRSPKARKPAHPFRTVALEIGGDGVTRTRYRLQPPVGLSAKLPVVTIEISVVDPGMAEQTPRGSTERKTDWLSPQSFLAPPDVHRFLRGTSRAARAAELTAAQAAMPETPEASELSQGAGWMPEHWAGTYRDANFAQPFAQGELGFDRSRRSPLRLLQYLVLAREEGERRGEALGVCTSLEDLHYVLSRIWWRYRSEKVERVGLEIVPGPATVLAWSTPKPGTTSPDGMKRAVLVAKPRFAPYWIAAATFDDSLEFDGAKELRRNPRRVDAYYESMGWTLVAEDLAEVLRLLEGRPLAAHVARMKEPRWSPETPWPLEEGRTFAELFGTPELGFDGTGTYRADLWFDPERCHHDYEPSRFLKRPKG
jgi:hypothetical protein